MPLQEINKDAISFKRLSGKAHTQVGFASTEESITSNIQIALTTIFGEQVNSNPVSNAGLSNLYDTDGIVEKVRFEIEIIPDTEIGLNQSQGYRLKLPSDYSTNGGALSSTFADGTFLHEALGRLQIVPSLYGELKPDGSTEYEPKLYQTDGITEITKFDPINWNLDPYSGILFVQDPDPGLDTQPDRPGFLDAYLFVGNYLDVAIQGIQNFNAGQGISPFDLSGDTITVDLENYTAPNNINISFTGLTGFIVNDNTGNGFGIRYGGNYVSTLQPDSLAPKAYVDAVASGLSVRDAVQVATTGNTDLTGALNPVNQIDGIQLFDGIRVLVKDQIDPTQNGIYTYSTATSAFTRSDDFDNNLEVVSGSFTSVISGDTNSATLYVVTSPDPIDIGTDDINWSPLALPLVYLGGVGIDVNGNVIDLDGAEVAGLGLEWDVVNQRFNLDFLVSTVGSGVSIFKQITPLKNLEFKSLVGAGSIIVSGGTNEVLISGSTSGGTNEIGTPTDGTYSDGLFPWVPATLKSDAFDDVNEFLLSLTPDTAPELDNISINDTSFVNGNLSFGASRNDIGFTNVSNSPVGNGVVDINGLYTASGTRKGIINSNITDGVLNDDISGNDEGPGIPFEDDAFKYGDEGAIVLQLNGSVISTLILSGSTGALSNSNIGVSAVKFAKFSSGADFTEAPYRTGTFSINSSGMTNGWNYVRVIHSGTTAGDIQTNYLEWVYDPNSDNISGGTATIDNIQLTGSRFISGVEYFNSGTVDYNVELTNVYKNVYSNSATAIQFTSRENLSDVTINGMDISGSGIINVSGQTSKNLPLLDSGATNPESTNINIDATLDINSNIVLGSVGSIGRVRSSITVTHPFTSKNYVGSQGTATGFLIYNIVQSNNLQIENFEGEVNRLEDRDYTVLTYGNINSGTYAWDSTENLLLGNSQHNTGMLVFNGELLYPKSSLLTTTYGITSGDFSSVSNAPAGNPNYSTASGKRNHIRLFKSSNALTQDRLTFAITHTGNATNFLTNGGTAGTPTGNQIKFEFLIKRANGETIGWVNPFATSGNPDGISRDGNATHTAGVTTVTCNLALKRVNDDDIIITRMFFADTYTQKVSNLAITNI